MNRGRFMLVLALAAGLFASHASRAHAQDSTAVAPDSVRAPHVRYVPLVTLAGYRLPVGEPWSPTESRLLLVKRGGLYVFDPNDSTATPRRLLEAQVLDARWSPEGTAIVCRVRVPTAVRGGVRLRFVEVMGGPSEDRVPRARLGEVVWADDGAVYFWDARTGARTRMQAPLSWRSKRPVLSVTHRPYLLQIPEAKKRRPRVVAFTAGSPPLEQVVAALMSPKATHVTILERFPVVTGTDSGRFLVQLQPPDGSLRTYVVNSAGERLARIGDAGAVPAFVGTSVSADGRYVIGHRAKQGAGTLLSSEPWLADAEGTWSTRITGAGSSVASRLSHHDLFLAHEDPDGDAVRVGRLEIVMP